MRLVAVNMVRENCQSGISKARHVFPPWHCCMLLVLKLPVLEGSLKQSKQKMLHILSEVRFLTEDLIQGC